MSVAWGSSGTVVKVMSLNPRVSLNKKTSANEEMGEREKFRTVELQRCQY